MYLNILKEIKSLITFSLLIIAHLTSAQQVINIGGPSSSTTITRGIQIGEETVDIKFSNLLNSSVDEISLNELKGKVIILEYWATWCGPCIPAMTHLAELKNQFGDDIEVIAILHEPQERLERFIKNKPSKLWHIADPELRYNKYFPHTSIPHTVVIDTKGKVAAITTPTEVTSREIEKLLKGKEIDLPVKENESGSGFDMFKDYFPKDESSGYSFEIQPPINGGFALTKRYSNGPWQNRRLTLINSPLNVIYRSVFNTTSMRMVYEGIDQGSFSNRNMTDTYCIDIVVPKGKQAELYHYSRAELLKADLPIKARVEKKKMNVAVLTCTNPDMLQKSTGVNVSTAPVINNASTFNRKGVSLSALAKEYIESFGLANMPVVDETNISGLFDFDLKIDLEDPSSLKNELAKLGLKLSKEEREIEVLILYKE